MEVVQVDSVCLGSLSKERETPKEEPSAMEHLQSFLEVFGASCKADEEFLEVVDIFLQGVEDADDHAKGKGKKKKGDATVAVPYGSQLLRIVIRQIAESRVKSREAITPSDSYRLVSALKVLIYVLDVKDEDVLMKRQNMINDFGGSEVALMMASCQDDALSKSGLELAISLLNRGNRTVQNRMMQVISL